MNTKMKIALGILDRLGIATGLIAIVLLLMLIDNTTERHERTRNAFGGIPL